MSQRKRSKKPVPRPSRGGRYVSRDGKLAQVWGPRPRGEMPKAQPKPSPTKEA